MLVGRGITASGGIAVPVGLIVPFNSASAVPANWTEFTTVDTNYIRGAGSGLAVATTTTGSVSKAGTTSTNANHGSGTVRIVHRVCDGTNGGTGGDTVAGSHGHSVTLTGTAAPPYKDLRFIKSTANTFKLPIGAMLLSNTDLSADLTQVEDVDRFIKGSTSYGGTGGSSTLSLTGTLASTGDHEHGTLVFGSVNCKSEFQIGYKIETTGAHSHSVTATGTLDTKYFYLTAWQDAAQDFDLLANGIAMWESLTPPDGWLLCDGTSGTPDLEGYFIKLGSVAQMGTSGGDDLCNVSGSSSSSGSHHHQGGGASNSSFGAKDPVHANSVNAHTHTVSASNADNKPKSYALAFIMKAA